MPLNHFWSKFLGLTASISLAAIAFSPSAKALQKSGSYQVAQATTCAVVVNARGGLYIRSKPSTDSKIIGAVWNGQTVTIEDNNLNGWVPIAGPNEGYVYGDYLSYC